MLVGGDGWWWLGVGGEWWWCVEVWGGGKGCRWVVLMGVGGGLWWWVVAVVVGDGGCGWSWWVVVNGQCLSVRLSVWP